MTKEFIDEYLDQMRKLGATPSFADSTTPAQYGNPYDPSMGLQGQPADFIIDTKPLNQGLPDGMLDYGISFELIQLPVFEGTAEEKYKQLMDFLLQEETRLAQDEARAKANILQDPLYIDMVQQLRNQTKRSLVDPNMGRDELNKLVTQLNNLKNAQQDRLLALQTQLEPRRTQLKQLAKQLDYYKNEYVSDQQVENARRRQEVTLELATEVAPETLEYFMAMTPTINNEEQAKEMLITGRDDPIVQEKIRIARMYALGEGPSPNEALMSGNPIMYDAAKAVTLARIPDDEARENVKQGLDALESMWDASKDKTEWRKYLSSRQREELDRAVAPEVKEQLEMQAVLTTFEAKKAEWKQGLIENNLAGLASPERLSTFLRPNEQEVVQAFVEAYTTDRQLYGDKRSSQESAKIAMVAALKVAKPIAAPNTSSTLMNMALQQRQESLSFTDKRLFVNKVLKDIIPYLVQEGNEKAAPLGILFSAEDFKPLIDFGIIGTMGLALDYMAAGGK